VTKNNIYHTISETIKQLQQLIENKNINVDLISEKNIVKAYYDEDRITQVLNNLLSNAIKFCPNQDGNIAISIKESETTIEVSVEDNGKGIDENDFEAIFDKFYQSSNQNIRKPVGSGLGLAICKKIIEHHRGKIWAENTKNSGGRITFTIPKYNRETTA
jgi:signal transduction histidine kinase